MLPADVFECEAKRLEVRQHDVLSLVLKAAEDALSAHC